MRTRGEVVSLLPATRYKTYIEETAIFNFSPKQDSATGQQCYKMLAVKMLIFDLKIV